jgi:hypothetical protein
LHPDEVPFALHQFMSSPALALRPAVQLQSPHGTPIMGSVI